MIFNDTHRFAFVHIPKCAGTSVRTALSPYDQAHARFYDKAVAEHPVLGLLDYHHIPLAVLRDYFADDYARLVAYRSFALVRDPVSRFPSSLHERFVQRDRIALADRPRDEVARELDKVMAELSRLPGDAPIVDPALIHFSRQCDYINLDGQQIVDTPRTVGEVDDLLEEVSGLLGRPVRLGQHHNLRYHHVLPALGRLQAAITAPIERTLPRWLWKPVYRPIKAALFAAGVVRTGRNPLADLPNADDCAAFIQEFYADDIRLFQRLDTQRRVGGEDRAARQDPGGRSPGHP